MKNHKILLTVLFCCLAEIAGRADNQYMLEWLSNDYGLSNNSVNCFCEDSRHRLWVGTWDGLNVYDGRTFHSFRHSRDDSESIGNNVIRQIVEKDSLSIWIATNDCISRWDERTGKFSNFRPGYGDSRQKEQLSYLLGLTETGEILVCAKRQGFYIWRRSSQDESGAFVPIRGGGDAAVLSMLIDDDDRVYLLTESREVWRYRLVSDTMGGAPFLSDPEPVETDRQVSDMILAGDLLILNYDGRIDGYATGVLGKISLDTGVDGVIKTAYRDGRLFMTTTEAVYCYDFYSRQTRTVAGFSRHTSVFTVYAGSQDIVWVGTDGRGVLKLFEYTSPFRTVLTESPVRCFARQDDGTVLVGTKGEGIRLFDKENMRITGRITGKEGLNSDLVYSMRKNSFGDIFIGTDGDGINYLRRNSQTVGKIEVPAEGFRCKSVYSMAFTHGDSLLWLGTYGYGLIRIRLERKAGKYTVSDAVQYRASDYSQALESNVIYSIVRDKNPDILWIGTRGGGVVRFNMKTERFEDAGYTYSPDYVRDMDILSMARGSDDCLWIGTACGLSRITEENGQAIFSNFSGPSLDDPAVHGIVEDVSGKVWLSTGNGIVCMDPRTGASTSYTSRNGLQNDEFSDGAYFMDNEKEIFFGGVSGFSYFKPEEMSLREFEPKIRLGELKINNKEQNIGDRLNAGRLNLSHSEAHTALTFSVGDFINNENCVFEYRISGLSDEWIYNDTNPTVAFTRLPPGNYMLEVRYTNGDRVWSGSVYSLPLHVERPWWLGGWAFTVYFLSAGIAGLVAFSVIRNRIRLNRKLLLEHVEKRQQQKIYEEQLNSIVGISNEFFTPLTLIYGPAQQLLDRADLDNYSKRYVQLIKKNADKMQHLLDELTDFKNAEKNRIVPHPEPVDLKLVLDSIVDDYTESVGESRISLNVRTETLPVFVSDRNLLEKVFFNLLAYAFKYTPAGGNIHIMLGPAEDGSACLKIRNSGDGLTDRQCSEIFDNLHIFETAGQERDLSTGIGLGLAKKFTEMLGGAITVSGEPKKYTEFTVTVPQMQNAGAGNRVSPEAGTFVRTVPVTTDTMPAGQSFTILVVEADKNIRDLLYDILYRHYHVSTAENTEEAVRMIGKNLPDLILCDLSQGDFSFIDRIRKDSGTAHILIVNISDRLSVDDRIAAVEHGADAYIAKPFHPRHILATVAQLFDKRTVFKEYFNSSRSNITVRDGITLHAEDERLLQEISSYIESNIDDETLSPASISDFMGIGKTTLYEKLKEFTGMTPGEYIRVTRLEMAAKLLRTTQLTVQEVMYRSGFGSKSYFYKEFASRFGASPKEYRIKCLSLPADSLI